MSYLMHRYKYFFKVCIHKVNHSNTEFMSFYIFVYVCVLDTVTIIYTNLFSHCYLYVKC